MLTRRAALAGAAAMAGCASAPAQVDAPVLAEAMAGKATPGMAALVMRGFRVEQEVVAGLRRLGDADRVMAGDRWHLGSDGKAMTASMVASVVESGALAWDTRLDEMLPGVAMRDEYRDVTLPDLMSHRAGLPENFSDLGFFNTFHADAASLTQQRLRYITAALSEAPIGPKRAAQSYSNTGFIIAAAAAERATGEDFESLIRARVFSPLNINSASFEQFGGDGEPCGHVDGRVADRIADVNPRMFAPAGGIRMTLQDWAVFCIDHMRGEGGDGRLLRAETYRRLHTPQGDTTAALGWGAQQRAAGRRGPVLVHSGSDGNWMAYVVLFPQIGDGVLVAANAAESMGGDAAALQALRALAATLSEPAEA